MSLSCHIFGRISELVVQSKVDRSYQALTFRDMQFTELGIHIKLKRSKMDQVCKGNVIKLGLCAFLDLCLILALCVHVSFRGNEPGWMFRHKDGVLLTQHQFWTITDKALNLLGLAHFGFSTHLFRIGTSSTAAALGYPPAAI